MKAQLATIEAAISLALVVSTITFVSSQTNLATANLDAQKALLQRNAALYDITNALEQNASDNNCIAGYYSNQNTCVARLSQNFSEIFGLEEVSITIGGSQNDSYGAATSKACTDLLLLETNKSQSVCIAVSN